MARADLELPNGAFRGEQMKWVDERHIWRCLQALSEMVFAEERKVTTAERCFTVELHHVGATRSLSRQRALEVRLAGPYRGPDTDTLHSFSLDFHDGTIEVDVAGLPAGALSGARDSSE